EGARHGPSIMPGGSPAAWEHVKPIFQAVAAKALDPKTNQSEPCCDWVGQGGAGHFVKMVHNGIEYGDMQLIGEAYAMMQACGMTVKDMHETFADWNRGELDSYLIEITRDILGVTDPETGRPMVDVILDAAGQKGTGKWTGITALDLGVPLTLIGEAVFARCLSAIKDERVAASKLLPGADFKCDEKTCCGRENFVADLRHALYASKIISYAQGYQLLRASAAQYKCNLNYIRSRFLGKIKDAFDADAGLVNLLLAPYFRQAIADSQAGWRKTVARAVQMGVPTPAFSSALAYYDGYRSGRLPANLLQAQRDYFGAHTYERVDKPRGQFFHTNWTGTGGNVTAHTYDA
ncbi:MAG: decarboxylating NADP(+)-dependent phosphogluconate dehydrogenase, partial [Planctomycetota bacterium]|nr:decarboxylating NADP(+)-dependent phosphogluconate dehydrogenase [Planctomycetota bacterium]